jgi:hypothetical protein
MVEKGKNKRCQGQHLKKNEVKTEIIQYILKNDNLILEPDLRDHLKNMFGISDIKTMKNHFKDLQKLQCIKKITNSGKENEWRIDSIKHLYNIKKSFEEIELYRYKRAVEIIANKFTNSEVITVLNSISSPEKSSFRAYLKLSPTFFDMCMVTDIETLYNRWIYFSDLLDDRDVAIGILALRDKEFIEPSKDYYRKELPYTVFKQCVLMDVLTGTKFTMLPHARQYIELKESGSMDSEELEKFVEPLGNDPIDLIRDDYLKETRRLEESFKKIREKMK